MFFSDLISVDIEIINICWQIMKDHFIYAYTLCIINTFILITLVLSYSVIISRFGRGYCRVRVMMFNATFNNISVISWRSVLLMEETGVLTENHRSVASHWQTLSHNVVSVGIISNLREKSKIQLNITLLPVEL